MMPGDDDRARAMRFNTAWGIDWIDLAIRPCVGCGYCCRKAPCMEALDHGHDYLGPCSYLTDHEDHWRCGLILQASEIERNRLWSALYIGEGCCSPLNSERAKYITPCPTT